MKVTVFLIVAVAWVALVLGRPGKHISRTGDLEAAAGHHHGGYGHGRVQIKVYRGQSKPSGHGGGHYGGYDTFAPHGYWVRQPPDNHYGYGHH